MTLVLLFDCEMTVDFMRSCGIDRKTHGFLLISAATSWHQKYNTDNKGVIVNDKIRGKQSGLSSKKKKKKAQLKGVNHRKHPFLMSSFQKYNFNTQALNVMHNELYRLSRLLQKINNKKK